MFFRFDTYISYGRSILRSFQSTISYLPAQLFRVAKVAQLLIRTKKLSSNKVIKYAPDAKFVGIYAPEECLSLEEGQCQPVCPKVLVKM